jgi:hypothetical protein
MATPHKPTPNGAGELYNRLSSLEAGYESLRTELTGYAKHTSDAIASLADQVSSVADAAERRLEKAESDWRDTLRSTTTDFRSYRDSSRPNWYALAAVVLSIAVAMASLIKSSTDAQVRPNTLRSEANALRIQEQKLEQKLDLQQIREHLSDVASLYRQMNDLYHATTDRRLEAIEGKITMRYSDSDDRQDAEIAELRRSLAKRSRRQ